MKTKTVVRLAMMWLLVGGGGVVGNIAAQEEEGSKGIKAEVFISNRPAEASPRPLARKRPTYNSSRVASPAGPPPGKVFAQLGVTVWRFRPATAADKTKELVEEEQSQPTEWSLERVADGALLAPGQRVRLGLESLSRDGYLYVIDREQYADGTFGDARLIFPTRRTPEGANSVKAGKVIYIPGAPRYFRIKPSQTSKAHVAEVLTVLVAPKPLVAAARLEASPLVVERAQLESWEKQWGAVPTKFEMEGGAGQTMSEPEQSAGLGHTELTQSGPVPQTVYRLAIKPDDTLLVTIPLRFAPPKP